MTLISPLESTIGVIAVAHVLERARAYADDWAVNGTHSGTALSHLQLRSVVVGVRAGRTCRRSKTVGRHRAF